MLIWFVAFFGAFLVSKFKGKKTRIFFSLFQLNIQAPYILPWEKVSSISLIRTEGTDSSVARMVMR